MHDNGKSVVITGGASGIGFEVAALLSGKGWTIVLLDTNVETLTTACETLSIDQSQGIVCSVTEEADVEVAVKTATRFGRLAAIVNSAGIGLDKPAVDTGVDEYQSHRDIYRCACGGTPLDLHQITWINHQHIVGFRYRWQQGS